jgi:glycosyltransferase involved in cell wall biosynthesis
VAAALGSHALDFNSAVVRLVKIAQVSPLFESVPPRLYGGTERVVSYLTEELVRQGHELTLFASGDSMTSAELVPVCSKALRLNPTVRDHLPYHVMMLDMLRERAEEFDVIHFHIDLLHYLLMDCFSGKAITTLHGRLDLPDLKPFYRRFSDFPLVSISHSQRSQLPPMNRIETVYHGLPRTLLPFQPRGGDYLAFLGRISPEKGPDRAIEIALRAGMPLKIAAKIDSLDQPYWDNVIRHQVKRNPTVEFIGEINEREKAKFLGNAAALLFPIDWPEPFGMAMIEAMSCGTPVIAFPKGSVPEVIDDGQSGFIVSNVDDAVKAVERAMNLSRSGVRECFERRFTVERMAKDYISIYRSLPGVEVGRKEQQIYLNGEASSLQIAPGH